MRRRAAAVGMGSERGPTEEGWSLRRSPRAIWCTRKRPFPHAGRCSPERLRCAAARVGRRGFGRVAQRFRCRESANR